MANYNTMNRYIHSPCYTDGTDCPSRTLGCHGRCEAYQQFWNERRAINAKRVEHIKLNDAIWDLAGRRMAYKSHYRKGRKWTK